MLAAKQRKFLSLTAIQAWASSTTSLLSGQRSNQSSRHNLAEPRRYRPLINQRPSFVSSRSSLKTVSTSPWYNFIFNFFSRLYKKKKKAVEIVFIIYHLEQRFLAGHTRKLFIILHLFNEPFYVSFTKQRMPYMIYALRKSFL